MAPKETPIRRWLDQWDMSMERLARLCDVSSSAMFLASRGARRPTDDLKMRVYRATYAYESENGVKKPKGIHPIEWFAEELAVDPLAPLPAPSKEPGKAREPGKRIKQSPAKAPPPKRKAR